MTQSDKVGLGLFGGIVLGVWIFGLLFGWTPDFRVGAWLGWGLVGLIIAAAVHFARGASEGLRVALVTTIGVLVTVVLLYAAFESDANGLAALSTFIGAGLVSAALPTPRLGKTQE